MGWTRKKRSAFEKGFYQFLDRCIINSKDATGISLGKNLFWGQRYFYDKIFDGLEQGIHKFFVLKSRQLGITTSTRALSTFYIGMHKGLKGALVFDTQPHRNEARDELVQMIRAIPPALGFPAVRGRGEGNRDELALVNGSKILFMNAGVRKAKASGGLGRSVGLSMSHMSELCMYDNDEGLEAFEHSLSEINPDRLYIYESTARGYNVWHEMWKAAREDPTHCCCIFLGWWSKDTQKIERHDPDFSRYGLAPPSPHEAEKIKAVKELYDFQITPEQLAWIRRKMDPAQQGVDRIDNEPSPMRMQEQPWTEDEAFQQTGATFFMPEILTDMSRNYVQNKFERYMFSTGSEFNDVKVYKTTVPKQTELKVWEQPHPQGVYVLGIDPAYGENPKNDRSCIQVLRCYADGADQVAEFAYPLITTKHLAWVIAAIMGWYGHGETASVRYVLELNGPGMPVFDELIELRHKIQNSYFDIDNTKGGLENVFRNVKTYIYARPDGMSGGQNWHFKSNPTLKIRFMERMRDFCASGALRIRSQALIDEMNTIRRDDDERISAPSGQKDDRVIAMALALECWERYDMKTLITEKRTRNAEEARLATSIISQVQLFNQNQLSDYFKQQSISRSSMMAAANRRMPWGGRY